MAYRDVGESLRSYRDRIASDLDEARRGAQQALDLVAKARVLEKELAETDALLAKLGEGPRRLAMLDDVRVAAPCPESWEQMVGDEHVRYCGRCEKNVYNLSSLTRDEAEALLSARQGEMCVRLFRRADGTVMTSDCPVGVKKRRRRRVAIAAVGGGLVAAAAALGLEGSQAHTTGVLVRPQAEGWTAGVMTAREVQPSMGGTGAPADPPPPQEQPQQPQRQPQPQKGPHVMTGVMMGRK
jgi:hypothetical protein